MTQPGTAAVPVTGANRPATSALYSALVGLTSLVILLQGVWAGLFIREGRPNNDTWVNVHSAGAYVAIALAAAATAVAATKLSHRRDLVLGTAILLAALVIETGIGNVVGKHNAVEVVHFPLAMILMGLAVYLPLKARTGADRLS